MSAPGEQETLADPSRAGVPRAGATAPPGGRRRAGPDGFDEFYRANVGPLTQQLFAYLGDRAEAQDVVHEAFCRAFARWRALTAYEEPAAWVRRVSWNLATSRWRRLRTATAFLHRQRTEYVDGPGPDRVALVRALAALPTAQRRAFVLHHVADLSVGEIAEMEDTAEGTVRSRLHRARTALAAYLADQQKEARHG